MRKIYDILLTLVIASCIISCSLEEIGSVQISEGGHPVTVNMNLSFPESMQVAVQTKAGEMNTRVYDFYIFVFDNAGNLQNKYYFPSSTSNDVTNYSAEYSLPLPGVSTSLRRNTDTSGDILTLGTLSGSCYMMGVANVDMKVGYSLLDELNDVTNMSELREVLAVEPTVSPSVFTMSGFYSPSQTTISTDGAIVIPDDGNITGYIHLEPVDAQIDFNVKAGNGSGRDFDFILDSWQVVNVPRNAYLFPSLTEAVTSYYDSNLSHQVDKALTGTGTKNTYSFNFFIQERLGQSSATISSYGDRAAWNGEDENGKIFTNAPANSTYVLLNGRYLGESVIQSKTDVNSDGVVDTDDISVEYVDANVTYTIFLGEGSDASPYTSFRSNRNTKYTYNVTVNGVKDISVEVRQDNDNGNDIENRADAEGDIIMSKGSSFSVDAHYSSLVLTFTKAEILEAIEKGMIGYTAVTPYGNRLYAYRDGVADTDQAPYADWVKFARKTSYTGGTHYPAKYNPSEIMTVRELLEELETGYVKGDAANGSIYMAGDVVRYTAFVQEYYYDTTPDGDPASWKDFVNVPDRKLMILADTETSTDEKSSITSAVYTITQKAIKTIYNKNADGLDRAWGLESVEEDIVAGRHHLNNNSTLAYYGGSFPESEKYGRKIALANAESNSSLTWNMIGNDGYLTNAYSNNAFGACLLRNRDLDGDGRIDPEEIRWYMPTLFQYQQMFIGMYGIEDLDARLYYNEAVVDEEWIYKHYLSSNNYQVMWAEEGLSNCNYQSSASWYGTNFTDEYLVRCVRDLGTPVTSSDSRDSFNDEDYQFQNIFVKEGRTIKMTYLNEASVRTTLENKEVSAPVVTFSENNRPAVSFEYAQSDLGGDYDFRTQNNRADNNQSTVCSTLGTGWRLPTVTEMSLIQQSGVTLSQNTITRTKFQFYMWNGLRNTDADYNSIPVNSRKHQNNLRYGRYGHVYGPGFFTLPDGNSMMATAQTTRNGKVRCVRDISD